MQMRLDVGDSPRQGVSRHLRAILLRQLHLGTLMMIKTPLLQDVEKGCSSANTGMDGPFLLCILQWQHVVSYHILLTMLLVVGRRLLFPMMRPRCVQGLAEL